MKDEALRLALDYITATNKNSTFWLVPQSELNKTVTAIKQALEQHMKAKAYIVHYAMRGEPELEWRKPKDCLSAEPLYSKREWQGLTDEEIDLLEELYAPPAHPDFVNDADHCTELIRHVQAKLKEKNHDPR